MIKVEFEKCMYDKFIEKKELTTQELLSIGFTSKDLTRLKEKGKLVSTGRGRYSLIDARGLFEYSREIVDEQYERANLALDRCLEISSDDEALAFEIFAWSLYYNEFDRSIQCMKIMERSEDEHRKRDYNLFLFLLGFATNLPEEYKERFKAITYEDICLLPSDSRYSDVSSINDIRQIIMRHKFGNASQLLRETADFKGDNLYAKAAYRLLNLANSRYSNRRGLYIDLINDGNYERLLEILDEDKERWPFTVMENYIYTLVKAMVNMNETRVLPRAKSMSTLTFDCAMSRRDFALARKLYTRELIHVPDREQDNIVAFMLDKLVTRMKELETTLEAKRVGDQEYAQLAACLMKQDLDGAFVWLDDYLAKLERSECRSHVVALIKLDLLDKNTAFAATMLALSKLSQNDYEFNVTHYCRNFFNDLEAGRLRRAAVYLDIISTSAIVGGVPIDTTGMRAKLADEMREAGMDDDALKVSVASPDVEAPIVVRETNEALASKCCQLAAVIDRVRNTDNLLMLAPMSDEESAIVTATVERIKYVQSFMVEDPDGEKHVVLKYCGPVGDRWVDKGDTFRAAGTAFHSEDWSNCIGYYQLVLPLTSAAGFKEYAYSQLGYSYKNRADSGCGEPEDLERAIDFLTIAEHFRRNSVTQKNNHMPQKNSRPQVIERLRGRTGYNGVEVQIGDANKDLVAGKGSYKKELNG